MSIMLTRHGQTNWNVQKKVMGRCDEPLNEKGMEQAEETSDSLKDTDIDLIICSPLKRAKQTSDKINEGRNIPIIYDDRIIERDFGEFEGKETKDFDFHTCVNSVYYMYKEMNNPEVLSILSKAIYEITEENFNLIKSYIK